MISLDGLPSQLVRDGDLCVACPAPAVRAFELPGGRIAYLCEPCIKGHVGWIYFARAGDVVKIGYSREPERRVRDLAIGSPAELELWHKQPGTQADEAELHKLFAGDHVRGEWFRVTEAIREYVGAA